MHVGCAGIGFYPEGGCFPQPRVALFRGQPWVTVNTIGRHTSPGCARCAIDTWAEEYNPLRGTEAHPNTAAASSLAAAAFTLQIHALRVTSLRGRCFRSGC